MHSFFDVSFEIVKHQCVCAYKEGMRCGAPGVTCHTPPTISVWEWQTAGYPLS